jgi:hypothetical protein
MMARTETQWRGSTLGMVAARAVLELKRMLGAARDAGADVSEDSHTGECFRAGVGGYESARQHWLAGDDQEAMRAVVYAAACVGLMARDNSALAQELQRNAAAARWQPLEPIKAWAIERREAQLALNPAAVRAELVREIAPEVRARAGAAGVPLSGDVGGTVTRWLREAGK